MTQYTAAQLHEMLDELTVTSGYWAGELTQLSIAVALGIDLEPQWHDELAEVFFGCGDCMWDRFMLQGVLEERPAELELIGTAEVATFAEWASLDPEEALAAYAETLLAAEVS